MNGLYIHFSYKHIFIINFIKHLRKILGNIENFLRRYLKYKKFINFKKAMKAPKKTMIRLILNGEEK